MLPGEQQDMLNSTGEVVGQFPAYSSTSLCQADLILLFQLVSLNTSTLLQEPASVHAARMDKPRRLNHHPVKLANNKTEGMMPFNVASSASVGGAAPVYDLIAEDAEGMDEDLDGSGSGQRDVPQTANAAGTSSSRFVPSLDILRSTGCFGLGSSGGGLPLSGLGGASSTSSSESRSDSQMNVQGLLEAVRKGRVFLLNALQVSEW
jgi:hypothetical protein